MRCKILNLLYMKIVNKSIVSKEGKKKSGIRITADSDTASGSLVKRLIFSNRFKIRFGIAVEYKLGVCHRVIVDQIVQL